MFFIQPGDDLRLLRRVGFTVTAPVFDTMIAARLTGATEFSYSALVAQHFGVTLTKGSQKANWALRPLSRQRWAMPVETMCRRASPMR